MKEIQNQISKNPIATVAVIGVITGFALGYYAHQMFPEKVETVILQEDVYDND